MSRTSEFQSLPAITRRTQVVVALRDAILAGQLRPGTKITEWDLAARFGVSRGPIREAIRELIDEALLINRPYSGTYVNIVDEKTMNEAYGLRRVLECYAFRLAWPRRNDEFRKELLGRHKALLNAVKAGRIDKEIRAEVAFHSLPYEFSGNEMLLAAWQQLSRRIQIGFMVYQVVRGGPSFVKAHERYVTLALGKDLDGLIAEVKSHIDLGLRTICEFFKSTKDGDASQSVRARRPKTARK